MAFTRQYFPPEQLQDLPVPKFRELPLYQAALKAQNRYAGKTQCSNRELLALLDYVLSPEVTAVLLGHPNTVLLETTAAIYLDFIGHPGLMEKDLQFTLLMNLVRMFTDRTANLISKWTASAVALLDALGLPEADRQRLYASLIIDGELRKNFLVIYNMPV